MTRVEDDFLMAIVPPSGPRPDRASLMAFLKLTHGTVLSVERSELEFLDAGGRVIGTRRDAFGLSRGMHLVGPYSEAFGDDGHRPDETAIARWYINTRSVEATVGASEEDWRVPHVVYLPLQVRLPNDCHLVVSIVNLGAEPINIANGVREAVLWIDGRPYESSAGRVWNGEYLVRPNRATRRRFRLSDFPGAPRDGTHEMNLEIVAMRSVPAMVSWRGEPWHEPRL